MLFLRLLGLCVVALLAVLKAEAAFRPPNIIFILADDLGWADVGYHGESASLYAQEEVTPQPRQLGWDVVFTLHS